MAVVLLLSSPLRAEVILPDLPIGTRYQLMFITSDTTDAMNSDLSHYDAIVSNYASSIDALLTTPADWYVVGTSPTETARDHIPLSAPVYNTRGELLATPATFWGSGNTNSTFSASINYDQNGNAVHASRKVWTGSRPDGLRPTWWPYVFGPAGCGEGYPGAGKWLWNNSLTSPHYTGNALYGISGPITAAPEPGCLALMATAALAGLNIRRRRDE